MDATASRVIGGTAHGAEGAVDAPPSVAVDAPPSVAGRDRRATRRPAGLWGETVTRRSLAVADAVAAFGAIGIVVALGPGSLRWPVLVAPILLVALAKAAGLYDRDKHVIHKTTVDEVPKLFSLATGATLLVWLCSGVMISTSSFTEGQVLALWALNAILLVSLRSLTRIVIAGREAPERCLVVGDERDARLLREQLALAPSIRANVVAVMPPAPVNGNPNAFRLPLGIGDVLDEQRIDRVVITRPPRALEGAEDLLLALRELGRHGVRISLMPRDLRVAGPAIEVDQLPGLTLLGVRGLEIPRSSRLLKRAFDLAVSSALLVVLAPAMALIALAIRLDSPGPILFRQRRVGKEGGEFTMLKFRSMVSEAEQRRDELRSLNESGPGLFKIKDDPRITRVGRFLRRTSLDELPQLWNVLRGDMSLVGPRPLIPEEDDRIEGRYRRRLEVVPGITGHWQILHNSRRITLAEMVRLDYLYVANWSLWNDIRLLARTVPFVVGRRGI